MYVKWMQTQLRDIWYTQRCDMQKYANRNAALNPGALFRHKTFTAGILTYLWQGAFPLVDINCRNKQWHSFLAHVASVM